MSSIGTAERPLRVAVVGSGPSGFYAAEALFKASAVIQVDMFDRLPTPFGLVRGGVAPDHPKIKSVTKVYERIAGHEHFAFLGNVTIGRDLSVSELQQFYDAVIIAAGAETDNRLGIPGEDLRGSHTATEFVGWYNGHPDYRDRAFDLSQEVAVVIGQGNVAMDVSRILAKTVDELKNTDIAEYALDALAESRVKEIHLVGRRGPVQAKFTPPEVKEIGELTDCDIVVRPEDLALDTASQRELDDPENQHARKNYEILKEFAARTPANRGRKFVFHFLKSPIRIDGNGNVQNILLEKNELTGEPHSIKAVGTGITETLPCGLVFRSVGYRGIPISGLPFDERRGVIPNSAGRITSLPGCYAVGWIKRGPSGVIGTNKPDSQETVAALLADAPNLTPCPTPNTPAVKSLLAQRGVRVVSFEDWRKIDAEEVARGHAKAKPREKFTRVEEMLGVL